MSHVLIVEPDDEFSLFLRHAVCAAGSRPTITDSIEGARVTLSSTIAIDLVIANARLPDGSGSLIAGAAPRRGRQTWIMRCSSRGSVEVRDARGVLFRGSRQEVFDFLTKAIGRRRRSRLLRAVSAAGTDSAPCAGAPEPSPEASDRLKRHKQSPSLWSVVHGSTSERRCSAEVSPRRWNHAPQPTRGCVRSAAHRCSR
jgi:DNA-binding NtrC family response regulator